MNQYLTERQEKRYNFIVSYIEKNLYPPTVREIAQGTGYRSGSSVYTDLRMLHYLGILDIKDGEPRHIIGFKFINHDEKWKLFKNIYSIY